MGTWVRMNPEPKFIQIHFSETRRKPRLKIMGPNHVLVDDVFKVTLELNLEVIGPELELGLA